jgi:hypothetical protein
MSPTHSVLGELLRSAAVIQGNGGHTMLPEIPVRCALGSFRLRFAAAKRLEALNSPATSSAC